MAQLGANADGEILEPGRVPDCYLGLRLDPPGQREPAGVLVVAPAWLLHPAVPQPDGTVVYALVTGHPDRTPGELVFLADLAVELRAWPLDTWSKVGVDPAGGRRRGHRLLAGRPPPRPPVRWAERRGGLGVGAAGDGLGARLAWRPARPPAQPGIPTVAACRQTTAGRGRPVTLAPVSAAESGRPASMDTRPRWRKRRRTADAAAASGSASCLDTASRRPPSRPDGIARCRRSAPTADTLAMSAGGGVPCGGHPGLDTQWGGGSAAAADPQAAAWAHGRSRRAYRTVGDRRQP